MQPLSAAGAAYATPDAAAAEVDAMKAQLMACRSPDEIDRVARRTKVAFTALLLSEAPYRRTMALQIKNLADYMRNTLASDARDAAQAEAEVIE